MATILQEVYLSDKFFHRFTDETHTITNVGSANRPDPFFNIINLYLKRSPGRPESAAYTLRAWPVGRPDLAPLSGFAEGSFREVPIIRYRPNAR